MKRLTLAVVVIAASASTAFASGVQGNATLASEQLTQGSSQAAKVKRSTSGRMQLEPLKASDFARRAPPVTTTTPAIERSIPESPQAEKVKRDTGGRMQLEPLKASDFTRRNDGGK